MAQIDFRNLFKAYGQHAPVIREVSLSIADGEFCVFVGPSGCGKSTLLRMVAGLEEITAGELAIGGVRMNDVPSARRGVAMVFQSYALFPHMTVAENIGFGLSLAKVPKPEIERKVSEAARVLQLEHLLDRKPKALSGGQRQRVAIGRAIVRAPGVFLFDEPLSNLDAALRVQTRHEIARLHRSFGNASTIYVTHDQVEAMTLADRILLLNTGETVAREGSVAQCGTPLELYHQPRNVFVAGFIGSPKMNFLPGTLLEAGPDAARVRLAAGEQLRCAVDARALAAGSAVTVGVRPEHVALGNGGQHVVREVQWQERLGDTTVLYMKVGEGADPFVVRAEGAVHADPGQRAAVTLPADALHLFGADGCAVPRRAELADLALPAAA